MSFSNRFMKGIQKHGKKSNAQSVYLGKFSATARVSTASKDSDAFSAAEPLFGNNLMSKNVMNAVGFSFGFWKVTQPVNSSSFLATAVLNWTGSDIIGFRELLTKLLITPNTAISFMTARTFIKMGVL